MAAKGVLYPNHNVAGNPMFKRLGQLAKDGQVQVYYTGATALTLTVKSTADMTASAESDFDQIATVASLTGAGHYNFFITDKPSAQLSISASGTAGVITKIAFWP